jgi:chemotaxis protein CheX
VQAQMTAPDLAMIVEESATTMLGIDLGERVDDEPTPGCTLCASVQFTGTWEGAVAVGCDERLGHEIAGSMFGVEPGTASDDEVGDALGELANMIAGNVKPLLPGAASLSLPTVVSGDTVRLGIPGATVWLAVTYARADDRMFVRIYQRSA